KRYAVNLSSDSEDVVLNSPSSAELANNNWTISDIDRLDFANVHKKKSDIKAKAKFKLVDIDNTDFSNFNG
ncbi:hypothetical protein, partial [Desulfocurvus sp. DL9XJH121]